jgi:ankyrin repeat protein
MPYVGNTYVSTIMQAHPPPYNHAEITEIERRRKKLNCGKALSDEQLLQIADPGPLPEETERMEKRDERDDKTWTPLMWASKEGHAPVVRELLAGGADISCTSKNGSTAISLAKKYGHEKCVELLERAKKSGMIGDKEYRGKGSARQPRPGNSTHVLFNTKDKDGKTPAHAASENGHADTLRVVHKGGCSFSATDEVGCTPAHYAAMNGMN